MWVVEWQAGEAERESHPSYGSAALRCNELLDRRVCLKQVGPTDPLEERECRLTEVEDV